MLGDPRQPQAMLENLQVEAGPEGFDLGSGGRVFIRTSLHMHYSPDAIQIHLEARQNGSFEQPRSGILNSIFKQQHLGILNPVSNEASCVVVVDVACCTEMRFSSWCMHREEKF